MFFVYIYDYAQGALMVTVIHKFYQIYFDRWPTKVRHDIKGMNPYFCCLRCHLDCKPGGDLRSTECTKFPPASSLYANQG